MKKLIFAVAASFSMIQSTHAITSELNQSINIYESILDAASTSAVISQNEFIVDIKRLTKGTDFGFNIRYLIKTVLPLSPIVVNADANVMEEADVHHSSCHSHHSHHSNHDVVHTYEVILSVLANPAIGPPIVTVKQIIPVSTHTNVFYAEEAN